MYLFDCFPPFSLPHPNSGNILWLLRHAHLDIVRKIFQNTSLARVAYCCTDLEENQWKTQQCKSQYVYLVPVYSRESITSSSKWFLPPCLFIYGIWHNTRKVIFCIFLSVISLFPSSAKGRTGVTPKRFLYLSSVLYYALQITKPARNQKPSIFLYSPVSLEDNRQSCL